MLVTQSVQRNLEQIQVKTAICILGYAQNVWDQIPNAKLIPWLQMPMNDKDNRKQQSLLAIAYQMCIAGV